MTGDPLLHELFPEGIYLIPERKDPLPADPLPPSEGPGENRNEGRDSVPDFRGRNNKGVLVLLDGEEFPDPGQEQFLMKVLAAVGLTADDIALIPHSPNKDTWDQVPGEKILQFGGPPVTGTDMPPYIPEVHGDRQILLCAPLDEIRGDKQEKGRLWKGLKEMFGL